MRPTHFFLIDVSHTAVTTGVTAVACSAIGKVLSSIQGKQPFLIPSPLPDDVLQPILVSGSPVSRATIHSDHLSHTASELYWNVNVPKTFQC